MIKFLKRLAFLGALFSPLSAKVAESDQVMEAFKGYKAAILGQKGEEAAGWVTKSTLEEYGKYVELALTADRKTVEGLPLFTRFQVLSMRARVPAETLRQATGPSIFAYAVNKDWIGKNGVMRTELGEAKVTGDKATAVAMINGEASPLSFEFKKEDGKWRVDIAALTQATAPGLAAAAAKSGKSETEFIFGLLERVAPKKPDDSLWTPPGKTESK